MKVRIFLFRTRITNRNKTWTKTFFARIIFVTDSNFSIPVTILPIRAKAIMKGNNSLYPELTFFDSEKTIKSGPETSEKSLLG